MTQDDIRSKREALTKSLADNAGTRTTTEAELKLLRQSCTHPNAKIIGWDIPIRECPDCGAVFD